MKGNDPLRKRDTRIPRQPFLWLTAALLFTLPPMFISLATWVPAVLLVLLLAKFWMEPRDYRLRSPVLKLLLGAGTLLAVLVTYGTVRGIEPGVSIVVALVSVKILEAHTARDFQVMVTMGWIVCLCGFFLSQDLAIALCLLVAFWLLLIALIQFHGGASPGPFWAPVKTAGKLLAQAIPLAILLFVLFPRVNAGLRFQIGQTRMAASGFSGELSPGSVSSLANSSDIAFRAEFPDGRPPRLDAMYWRGAVMWQGRGLEWRASEAPAAINRSTRRVPVGEPIRQWITIEPHGAHWMFALDRPVESPPGTIVAPGNYIWSGPPIRKQRKYEVKSFTQIRERELSARERKTLLEVPSWTSPAVRELALSWKSAAPDPRDIVRRGLDFFRSGFRYSLSPGEYKNNDLDEFLFHRRVGFCEHYAASYATLMRLAGVPARVVVGYLGGEYNEMGKFFLIRQADTHAWCEVWLPENGWVRIDPTAVVAPDRVNLGLNSFLERRAAQGQGAGGQSGLVRNFARSALFTKARLAWQTLNYAWDTRVLSFDDEAQETFLAGVGMGERGPLSLVFRAAILIGLLLGIYFAWTRTRTRAPVDRVKTLYNEFCRHAARHGAKREPWEGPIAFSSRSAKLLPNESERIRDITSTYIALRYANAPPSALLDILAKEVRAFSHALTKTAAPEKPNAAV